MLLQVRFLKKLLITDIAYHFIFHLHACKSWGCHRFWQISRLYINQIMLINFNWHPWVFRPCYGPFLHFIISILYACFMSNTLFMFYMQPFWSNNYCLKNCKQLLHQTLVSSQKSLNPNISAPSVVLKRINIYFHYKKLKKIPSKVAQKTSNPLFSLLPWVPKQPKQKNSCSNMRPIDQLYMELGSGP